MAHDADDLLPDLDLLPSQLRGHPLQHDEPVLHRVQLHAPPYDTVGLFFRGLARRHGEEGVLLCEEGPPHLVGAGVGDVGQAAADETPRGAEQAAGREVAKDDAVELVDEEDAHGGALEEGVEEQLALVDLVALQPERVSHPVVQLHELAELVAPPGNQPHAEVVFLEAADAVGHGLQQSAHGAPETVQHPRGHRDRDGEGHDEDGECRQAQRRGGRRDRREKEHVEADEERQLSGEAEAGSRKCHAHARRL